ncbi:acyl-CoA carboxylase subunit beta [uncultured Cytophaga sp.]|uniref:acyl-CoA carboxylase subunit beta n=1 Tax=uncultured Cytophaga sp. TaxID=160238 RepID=UPI0026207C1A|nr:acyl-CoA carboxylase subunit beta [uncultured Cytophaga sp.]
MSIQSDRNKIVLEQLCTELKKRLQQVYLGGGEKRLKAEEEKGKLTVRNRVSSLFDKKSVSIEIGALAAEDMYTEVGGCPSAGVVVKMGYVEGRLCIIVANDATVKAGAWFPMTAKKNLRAQEIAMENRIPIIYLVDSAGVFLPMQNEVFADKEHFGRIFRNNAWMSSEGILQVAAVMGSCVAGGAYLPIMSDEAFIVEDTGSIFLAGSYLVKAAIGETIDNEALGGATTQTEISGIIDHKCKTDQECLTRIRAVLAHTGHSEKAGFDRIVPSKPKEKEIEIYELLPEDRSKPYDMMDIIHRLVDHSNFEPYKELYGQTIICGYARIDGWAVGIVANQRKIVKTKKNEMQMGGVIYSDSADKAARFIMNCNQRKVPLLFLQDVTGFMVGSRSEQGGIIKDGAKMVNAMANSVVPKFTVIIGNSYGAGNYAMCGKSYDPRLIVAWPSAQIGVMSGAAAAKTLLQIKVSSLKAKGKEITPEAEATLLKEITDKYNEELSPYYAAARLWVDAIIDPLETRTYISMGIEAANNNPKMKRFNVGVLQT